ncbi:MAG: BlaI/MecI/CopY family transcriptional regulator [Gaiellaceae bacterium]
MTWLHRFRVGGANATGALGPLEASVMRSVWARGNPTLTEIHGDLGGPEQLSFNTVMTAAGRLAAKGLLAKARDGRAHRWRALVSRLEFASEVSRQVSAGLLGEFGTMAVTEFVSALEDLQPEDLALLEELAREARERRSGPQRGAE